VTRKKVGNKGEALAKEYLEKLGHITLEKNYYDSNGEIDLITKKDETIFFVEVKTRTTRTFGEGYEAVSARKIQKIEKVAEKYLVNHCLDCNVQILVISISLTQDLVEYELLEVY
jgi:putative endonuclease